MLATAGKTATLITAFPKLPAWELWRPHVPPSPLMGIPFWARLIRKQGGSSAAAKLAITSKRIILFGGLSPTFKGPTYMAAPARLAQCRVVSPALVSLGQGQAQKRSTGSARCAGGWAGHRPPHCSFT